ncbi:TonB-dependent receptor [Bacteroides reticulotermitis]|uniref:TonB-dependent receptor n=2 Tax=Bacteroides reticulotermitis TaxID=1133319 RepID=W4URI9_9BACE|nr:TonB-dependent receptor [Bacteroides reticulotermitis]MBB4044482.1 TonB-linked SusC/RagA family outer membrane protein [Bacteroides reticulotermitis]GAE83248.1 TonB-dependent receptor [Bacteroides reticulotermitis JCM 10512]
MKTKICLLLIICFSVTKLCAQSGTEVIDLSFENVPLKEAIDKIEKASEYTFSYNVTEIDIKQLVSLHAKKEEIRLAIRRMLEPTDISFQFQRQRIILTQKEFGASKKGVLKKITGIVKDEFGEPIIGATVLVKGTINGSLTDLDGKYSIEAKEGETLEFRYIGYKSVDQKIRKESSLNIVLAESNINLDDVIVIGYGQQKKESVVSSVNSIKPAEIAIPTRSLSNIIAGQVAGVIAIQRSGEPGNDDASFWIRGQSSYAGGTSPLVLVDGVPRKMNDIDVDEIESFTVLKDAAATAVYGSEGANGVVLITSKRGRAQKTIISFNAQYSVATPTRMTELMSSHDYLSMWNEASWNDAGNPDWNTYEKPYSNDVLEKYRSGIDTDLYPNSIWTDLLSKNTHNQRYTINFRGGSEKTRFFASGAYYSEDGIFKSNPLDDYNANIGLKRYNLRSNIDMDISSTTQLSIDLSGQYKTKNNPGNSSDQIFKHIVLFPTHLVPMLWSDGTASVSETDADGRYNPYNLLNFSGYSKSWYASLQTKATLKQKLDFIAKGLSIQGSISFDADFSSVMKRSMSPDKYIVSGRDEDGKLIKTLRTEGSPLGEASVSSSDGTKKIYIEAQLNYNRTFAQIHEVSGVVVYNQKETQYQGSRKSSGAEEVGGISLLPYRKQNVVARGTYSYDSRYVAEASFGATGSENFAPGHRWGIFPAAGIAWNLHAEKFMQKEKTANIFSKIRLRVSYGLTGNDNTGSSRFVYRELLTNSGNSYLGLTPGTGGGATNNYGCIYENTFAAPSLSWEVEKKANFGLDLGLFRGRVDITADYFTNKREDILITRVTIPTATGFRINPWQNFGTTTNKGFDGSIVIKQNIGDWKLSARGNFTYAKNKIEEKDEIPQQYPWLTQTGTSIGVNKIYVAERLFTNNDFYITQKADGSYNYQLKEGIATYDPQVKPGDIKYKDLNEDGYINDMDQTYYSGIYPNNPQIVYGFGLNIEWKGFYTGIFFQGVGKASTNLKANTNYFVPFALGKDQSSARAEAASHWSANDPNNSNVLYPRLHTNDYKNNTENSTWWYREASFLRLKNFELGYQFSKKVIQKMKMQNLRIYVQGSNLAVWDNIKMWDPELGNSGSKYPINRTWTFGLDVTF